MHSKFRCFFGIWENLVFCSQDLLTFSSFQLQICGRANLRRQNIIYVSLFSPKVRPLSVEIHSLAVSSAKSEGDNLMFSGHNESWTCIAYGSYPSPSVSWWIDDRFKLDHHEEVRTYIKLRFCEKDTKFL